MRAAERWRRMPRAQREHVIHTLLHDADEWQHAEAGLLAAAGEGRAERLARATALRVAVAVLRAAGRSER